MDVSDDDAEEWLRICPARDGGRFILNFRNNKAVATAWDQDLCADPDSMDYIIQIIPVNLNLELATIGAMVQDNKRYQALNTLFAHYVISRFDLGVCRVSMRWDLDLGNKQGKLPLKSLILYDLSSTPDVPDASLERIEKYTRRKNPNRRRRIPCLSSLSLYALFRDQARYLKPFEVKCLNQQ